MNITVEIERLAYGAKGIARRDGKVVFVPFTAPGDVALVRISRETRDFCEAELVEIKRPSPMRQTPPCPVYGTCGGCHMQHIVYTGQVALKQDIFKDTLERIGKLSFKSFDPPHESKKPYNYRSRARFHIEGRRWGFFGMGTWNVVDIKDCPILDERLNNVFKKLKTLLIDGLSGEGVPEGLYSMEAACGREDEGVVVSLYFARRRSLDLFHERLIKGPLLGEDRDKGAHKDINTPERLWGRILELVPEIKGLELVIRPVKVGRAERVFSTGDTKVSYDVDSLRFTASSGVFTQGNLSENPSLVKKVLDYADLRGDEEVLDLFAGIGNITLPLAAEAASVTGVELNPAAVRMARENASKNSIRNVRFKRARADRWVRTMSKALENKGAHVVVLDPPRGGGFDVVKELVRVRPPHIVYLSCSAPTLARDASYLLKSGYRLKRAGIIDMFPQTYHFECILRFDLDN